MSRLPKPVTRTHLRRWRTTFLRMTQEEAARAYGVSLRSWGRYEQGTTPVPRWLASQVRWKETGL